MSKDERLCPFKKTAEAEYNDKTGRKTIHERFEVCAGERCMAYQRDPLHGDYCQRLGSGGGNPKERTR